MKTDFSDLLWCMKSWNGTKINSYFIVHHLWYIDFSSNWINRYEETEEQKAEDAFREVITSCRSLSTYEPNNIKSAIPQVISLNWLNCIKSNIACILISLDYCCCYGCLFSHRYWDFFSIFGHFSATSWKRR